jgi:hypothetical protein
MMNRFTAAAAAAILAAGCADRGVVDVATQQADQPEANMAGVPGSPGLTVMTWNVYYGTDPTPILFASPGAFLDSTTVVWQRAINTSFPDRAQALARAIAANRPELVGLQEAALYRMDPSDFLGDPDHGVPPNPIPNAQTVVYDFLQLLTGALEARGVHYVVAVADSSSDLEVPVITDTGLMDVRLTDRDAVLVRADLVHSIVATDHRVYTAGIPIPLGAIAEGWSSVDVRVREQTYRFVSTHLEVQDFPGVGDTVQFFQASELLGTVVSDRTLPTILVGDFNSDVHSNNPAKTRSYNLITGTAGGFTDSWLRPFWTPPGLTCCQSDDLKNRFSTFDQRIDFIFTRDMPQARHVGTLVLARRVVGDERGDRTKSGLWPSDHGGVVATFLVPPVGPHKTIVAE